MEAGNITVGRTNFFLEELVIPRDKDFTDRPSCPECGCKPKSNGITWMCRQCRKTWLKQPKLTDKRHQLISMTVQARPPCKNCGGVLYGKGKKQYQCNVCRKTISRWKVDARKSGPIQSGDLVQRVQQICPQGTEVFFLRGHQIS